MAVSQKKTLGSGFVAMAEGPGDVTITPDDLSRARWLIAASAVAVTGVEGHAARAGENVSMTLASGEVLQARGGGTMTMTADNPL